MQRSEYSKDGKPTGNMIEYGELSTDREGYIKWRTVKKRYVRPDGILYADSANYEVQGGTIRLKKRPKRKVQDTVNPPVVGRVR